MSTVSVIIPCHREGGLLREAVDSALHQTHPGTDVIVVADGVSDPDTQRILDEVSAHERVQVLHKEKGGVSSARNMGIRTSQADFLIFLDGDDHIDPTFAEAGLNIFREHPEAYIAGGQTLMFGTINGLYGPEFNLGCFLNESLLPVGQMVRRKDAIRVGGFDESLRRYEDQDFFMKILALAPDPHRAVVQLPHPLYYYRKHPQSETASGDYTTDLQCQAKVFRNNAQFIAQHAEEFIEWRVGKVSLLNHFRRRYGRVENQIARLGGAVRRLRADH